MSSPSRRGRSVLELSALSATMTRASLVGNRDDAPVMDDRGIEDLMDQLDVFIAQREFDEAVDSIKKGWGRGFGV